MRCNGGRSAIALCPSALGFGLPCPLRRVLAGARQPLLGRHLCGDRVPAAARSIAAKGLVPDDRHRDRRHNDRGADRVFSAGSLAFLGAFGAVGRLSALSAPRCSATSRPTRRRSPAIPRSSLPPTHWVRREARVRTSLWWRSPAPARSASGSPVPASSSPATDLGGAQRRLASTLADLAAEIAGGFTRMLAKAGPQLPDMQTATTRTGPTGHRARTGSRPGDRRIEPLRYHVPILESAINGLFRALDGWRGVATHLSRLPQEIDRTGGGRYPSSHSARIPIGAGAGSAGALGGRSPDRCAAPAKRPCGRLLALPADTPSLRLACRRNSQGAGWHFARARWAGAARRCSRPTSARQSPLPAERSRLASCSRQRRARVRRNRYGRALLGRRPPGQTAPRRLCSLRSCCCCFPRRAIWPTAEQSRSRSAPPAASFARQSSNSRCSRPRHFPGLLPALGLVLIPVGFAMARSRQPAALAVFTAMGSTFLPLLAPTNPMSYDTVQFYNSALAVFSGCASQRLRFGCFLPSTGIAGAPPACPDPARSAPPRDRSPAAELGGLGGPHVRPARGIAGQAEPLQRAQLLAALSVGNEIIQLRHLAPAPRFAASSTPRSRLSRTEAARWQ